MQERIEAGRGLSHRKFEKKHIEKKRKEKSKKGQKRKEEQSDRLKRREKKSKSEKKRKEEPPTDSKEQNDGQQVSKFVIAGLSSTTGRSSETSNISRSRESNEPIDLTQKTVRQRGGAGQSDTRNRFGKIQQQSKEDKKAQQKSSDEEEKINQNQTKPKSNEFDEIIDYWTNPSGVGKKSDVDETHGSADVHTARSIEKEEGLELSIVQEPRLLPKHVAPARPSDAENEYDAKPMKGTSWNTSKRKVEAQKAGSLTGSKRKVERRKSSFKHTAKAHNLKGQLPEGRMESLATTIRFITLNCRTLSSELQQAALSRLLRYLCVPLAALQETRMRDRPVISIENYTTYCGDADEDKVGGCAIAVRNDYRNLVEKFGSTSSRCAFLRLRDSRGQKLWIVSAHAPTETAEDNSKDAFYDELNALMSKIRSQQVVIVGIDANAKMELEQQSDVLRKWYYAAERTSDNGDRLVDLCEQTGLIIASTFKRNYRRHQLT
ncbi:hypothetical protein RB195_005814 [Necator americanus]